MNEEIISLFVGWVFIASFFLWLEIVNRKRKDMNKVHRDRENVIKNKRN